MSENSPVVQQRLDKIETQLGEFAKGQITLVESAAKTSQAIETISSSISQIRDSMEQLRQFEARAEERQKNHLEHRDRLDRRIDAVQRDMVEVMRDWKSEKNRIYDRLRAVESHQGILSSESGNRKSALERWWKVVSGVIVGAAMMVITYLFNSK